MSATHHTMMQTVSNYLFECAELSSCEASFCEASFCLRPGIILCLYPIILVEETGKPTKAWKSMREHDHNPNPNPNWKSMREHDHNPNPNPNPNWKSMREHDHNPNPNPNWKSMREHDNTYVDSCYQNTCHRALTAQVNVFESHSEDPKQIIVL